MTKQITIGLVEGRWLLNNKTFKDCTLYEQQIMNTFFKQFKTEGYQQKYIINKHIV